jgi:hypothetical protein
MLHVAIHKDVGEYQPKLVGKLTNRTLFSIIGAVGFALLIGTYSYFVLGIPTEDVMVLIYAASLPFWCIGFLRPKRMKFEQFFPLWLRHKLTDNRLVYTSSVWATGIGAEAGSHKEAVSDGYRRIIKVKGIEAWSPSDPQSLVPDKKKARHRRQAPQPPVVLDENRNA